MPQRVVDAEVGVFKGELDAVAEAKIDVDVWDVGYGLRVEKERHVAEVNFPLFVAGSAGVVGVVGWAALGEDGWAGAEQDESSKDGEAEEGDWDLGRYRGGGEQSGHGS
jgi:hypothetical protein